MKNRNKMSRILPLLIVVVISLLGSCSKVSNITKPSGARHSVVVIHSWDSIGEEKELFSQCMEDAFRSHDMAVDVHHIYANMLHRSSDVVSQFDWPTYSEQIKQWKPEVILLNDDPIVDWVLTSRGRDSIFQSTPIVFAGVSALLRDSLSVFPAITGFEDRVDLARNIEIIMKMAKTQSVHIELDYRDMDERLRAQFQEELRDSTKYINNTDFRIKDFDDEFLRKTRPGIAVVNFVSAAFPYRNCLEGESDSVGKATTRIFYQQARDMWQLQVRSSL